MGASGGGRGPERQRRPPSQEPVKGDNMERTPEEIMKGLECHDLFLGGGHWNICVQCPYDIGKGKCSGLLESDALTLIQQLEAERDAYKEALGLMVYQYCVRGDKLDHLYMCAGETAFRVLGLEQYGDTRTLESWLFPECQEEET